MKEFFVVFKISYDENGKKGTGWKPAHPRNWLWNNISNKLEKALDTTTIVRITPIEVVTEDGEVHKT